MLTADLGQLCRRIAADPALLKTLDAATGWVPFIAQVVQVGRECGYDVTPTEIETALCRRHIGTSPWNNGPIEWDQLAQWLPASLKWRDGRPSVEWCYCGTKRLTEPFFEDTIRACRSIPLARLVGFETPTSVLEDLAAMRPGLTPTGFIFHLSRCGSTLIAQLLAALPQNIVVSEPPLLDDVLRGGFHDPAVTDEQRVTWLRGAVQALGLRRHPEERNLFIKFDSWHIRALPLIRRAFPDIPWVFVYRDPVEVIASHARERGEQMVPSRIEPAWFGFDPAEIDPAKLDEYCARVLASLCEAAYRHQGDEKGRLIEYRQLPEAVWTWLPGYFGVTVSPDDTSRMRHAAQFHAKRPVEQFTDDSRAKQARATETMRGLAARWVRPHYDQLEALRRKQESPA